ncbi:TSUP family transporter [Kitasatospora sp. NRRL B-11411]|uniref:sulfite exporter TauE/SafE family protein n=1 Tax=Kitasatospora sp. NRRL B-11411 TaxID=1463822 RepID=UPI0009E0B63E|nr:TSUP family transporter [Kitasatospora sp. NRRL B-11411]
MSSVVLLALVAGAVVGLALGGLGGGGSMLAVPALIYLIGLTPGTATTASLLIVAVTSLTGLLAHARAGRVRWREGLLFGAAGLPLAALGGALSRHLPGPALTAAFALLAGLAAWRMLAGGRRTDAAPSADGGGGGGGADGGPEPIQLRHPAYGSAAVERPGSGPARVSVPTPAPAPAPSGAVVTASAVTMTVTAATATASVSAEMVPAGMNSEPCPLPEPLGPAAPLPAPARVPASARRSALAGAGLGAATGVLGVGGGFLAVPALVSFLAFPMAEAIGTSLLVITLNSLAALLPRLGGAAEIPWSTVGPFAAAAILGAWDGKRLAAKLSGRTLQRLFAGALLAVAALMLVDAML